MKHAGLSELSVLAVLELSPRGEVAPLPAHSVIDVTLHAGGGAGWGPATLQLRLGAEPAWAVSLGFGRDADLPPGPAR